MDLFTEIANAIVTNLKSREDYDPTKDGVLELFCGNGKMAKYLKENGIKKYHGVDADPQLIDSAKKAVTGYSRRFHVINEPKEVTQYKHDIVLSYGTIPYDLFPSGQRAILISDGYANYDQCCYQLSPYFQKGATTVQFGEYFLTIGKLS